MNRQAKTIIIILLWLCSGLLCGKNAIARDIKMELTLDRELIEVGDVLQLGLIINNIQNVPAPQLPEIEGFKSQYFGPSTQMSIINGRTTSSITHRYRLVAIKTGMFTIGPFSFTYQGDNYTTDSAQIKVVNRGQGTQQGTTYLPSTTLPDNTQSNIDGKIFLVLIAGKTKAYINERIPVTVKLYTRGLRITDPQYPFLAGEGFVKEEFSQWRQYKEVVADEQYDILEFSTWLYPTKEGQITVGPAKVKCNIVVQKKDASRGFGFDNFFDDSFFSDFFSRVQVYPKEVTSAELLLNVMPFPEKDKPKEFSGAVGNFTMDGNAAPLTLKAGDPITLNIKISGTGNLDSVQSPIPENLDGFKVYAAEVQQNEGTKHFQQVIIPKTESITQIPEIRFTFLNPEADKYVTITKPPLGIEVQTPDEKDVKIVDAGAIKRQVQPSSSTRVLGKDIIYIKEDIGPLQKKGAGLINSRIFLSLQLLPLLFLIGTAIFQKQQDRLSKDIRYARKLRAPKIARGLLKKAKEYLDKKQQTEFYDQIFKTLQQYLGHRFNRPTAGITSEVVDELIASEKLDKEIAAKLKMCFSDCDMARYTISKLDSQRMHKIFSVIQECIDYLERKKK